MEYPYMIEFLVQDEPCMLAGYHEYESFAKANAKIMLPILAENVRSVVVSNGNDYWKSDEGVVARWDRNAENDWVRTV